MSILSLAIGFEKIGYVSHQEKNRLRLSTHNNEIPKLEAGIREGYPQAKYLLDDEAAIKLIDETCNTVHNYIVMGIFGELCVAHTIAHALSKGILTLAPQHLIIMNGTYNETLDESVKIIINEWYAGFSITHSLENGIYKFTKN